MRRIEDEHWWFVARRRVLESVLRSLQPPPNSDILEVGCGTGGNLAMLSMLGNVIGVEEDETAALMAKERGTAPVLVGSLPDGMPALPVDFDLVCLFDVIEHIEDDAASLQAVSKLVKPDGRIILTVPAFSFLWSKHDEENRHFRRYRISDIQRLVSRGGMTLDYASYFNFWLFPPVAAVRLIRKVFPYRESWKDMRKPPELINRLLQSIFASERSLLGRVRLPYGMSLVAVISTS